MHSIGILLNKDLFMVNADAFRRALQLYTEGNSQGDFMTDWVRVEEWIETNGELIEGIDMRFMDDC